MILEEPIVERKLYVSGSDPEMSTLFDSKILLLLMSDGTVRWDNS